MLGSVLVGRAVQQPLALHQPRQAAQLCGSLQPARVGQRARHDLGSELCMSEECHLVGFYFIFHISLKKKLRFFKEIHRCA